MEATMKTKTISKTKAEAVLAAVRRQWRVAILPGDQGPVLVMDFDWTGSGPRPSIVWEEGPYEWAYLFPHGGIEEEFGSRVADMSDRVDTIGVFVEPITSWAIGIYPKDW